MRVNRVASLTIHAAQSDWHNMPIPKTETAMPTRNIVLTEHQSSLVDHLVNSGRYQNASEVLREGLRLVEHREAENASRLQALRAAIQVGIDDIEAGRFKSFDSAESLEAHLKTLAAKAISGA
jgi:antitoxin ParD1/3/4